jgi:hypothetical protein
MLFSDDAIGAITESSTITVAVHVVVGDRGDKKLRAAGYCHKASMTLTLSPEGEANPAEFFTGVGEEQISRGIAEWVG